MIFDWFKPRKLSESKPTWEYSEKPVLPVYNKEHRETMDIIENILTKLDEIEKLVVEMKDKQ
jgi:hypothetical protein